MLEPAPVIPEKVVVEACGRFGLGLAQIQGGAYRNRRSIVAKRWVIRTLHDAGHSCQDIADALLIDHTTVLYHLRRIAAAAAPAASPGAES